MSQEPLQPLQILSYTTKQKLEQASVRCIGWIGLLMSIPAILHLLLDVILLAMMKPPSWFIVLQSTFGDKRFQFRFNDLPEIWVTSIHLLVVQLLAILLLAGSIGCLRRYARARAWMISFAIARLAIVLIDLLLTVQGILFRDYGSMYWSVAHSQAPLVDVVYQFYLAAESAAFPVLILWFMTRRYVRELYAQCPGDE